MTKQTWYYFCCSGYSITRSTWEDKPGGSRSRVGRTGSSNSILKVRVWLECPIFLTFNFHFQPTTSYREQRESLPRRATNSVQSSLLTFLSRSWRKSKGSKSWTRNWTGNWRRTLSPWCRRAPTEAWPRCCERSWSWQTTLRETSPYLTITSPGSGQTRRPSDPPGSRQVGRGRPATRGPPGPPWPPSRPGWAPVWRWEPWDHRHPGEPSRLPGDGQEEQQEEQEEQEECTTRTSPTTTWAQLARALPPVPGWMRGSESGCWTWRDNSRWRLDTTRDLTPARGMLKHHRGNN